MSFRCILALLIWSVTAPLYAQDAGVYQLNYYSHRNNSSFVDQPLRIVNTGEQGSPMSLEQGTACADLYIFDAQQVMIECCSCRVTANGMLDLSLRVDLTANPLTGSTPPDAGVVKLIVDESENCNETSPMVTDGLGGWGVRLQALTSEVTVATEGRFARAALSSTELNFLGQACAFVQYLGSGKGICRCGSGN